MILGRMRANSNGKVVLETTADGRLVDDWSLLTKRFLGVGVARSFGLVYQRNMLRRLREIFPSTKHQIELCRELVLIGRGVMFGRTTKSQ